MKFLFSLLICFTLIDGISQPTLLGYSTAGGTSNLGVLFAMPTGSNNYSNMVNLNYDVEGINPQYSTFAEVAGKLYGLTNQGGTSNFGVLYEYDPATNQSVKRVNFIGTSNGSNPRGSLIAFNNKLYGMTYQGGTSNLGTIFEFDPSTNILIKKFDFNGAANGSHPYGSLILAPDGMLYGLTSDGGSSNIGVIFQFNLTTNTFTKKFDFTTTNGSNPYGNLTLGPNGKLYGMTYQGGTNAWGVIFEYDPITSVFAKKMDFIGGASGGSPKASFMLSSNGKFYGVTTYGGTGNFGTIFEYDALSNIYIKKYDFVSIPNGCYPNGTLFQGLSGKLYGLAYSGGGLGLGVLFAYDLSTAVYSVVTAFNGTLNGSYPMCSLYPYSNGKIYGVTSSGGLINSGVIFEFDTLSNTVTKKLDFQLKAKGSSPSGSLMKANNGKVYGTTDGGGANNLGVLLEYDLSLNSLTKKIDFSGALNGSTPIGALIEAANGKLYGLTNQGGVNNFGILYSYDTGTNILSKLIDFNGTPLGASPRAALTEGFNGKLYGLTSGGGNAGFGTLFEYDIISNNLVKKVNFANASTGTAPHGSLTQATNGKLYGLTFSGGANNFGVLFAYDPSNGSFNKIIDFAGASNGAYPEGSLIQAANGMLYGTTSSGGANNAGCIFEFNPANNIYTKKYDFLGGIGGPGHSPWESLVQASNNKLYGTTNGGGTNGSGVIFEFDLLTNTYIKKLDLIGTNGANPQGNLIEVNACPLMSIGVANVNPINCYGNSNGSISVNTIGGSGFTYTWLPSGGNNSISSFLSAGVYTCVVKNSCNNTSSVSVSVLSPPAITLTSIASSTSICSGQSSTLSASAIGGTGIISYSWSSSQTTSTTIETPTITTNYIITVTDANSCSQSNTIALTVNVIPTISVSGATICSGESYTLNPIGANTYTYSSGTNIVSPLTTASYSVTGTSTAGCVSATPAIVQVSVNLSPTITTNSGTICDGQSFTLSPTGALTYTFSSGSAVISPTITTSYSVTGTDVNGCTSLMPTIATVSINPTPTISVNSGAICSGDSFTINSSGANTYTFSSGTNIVSPTSTSAYSVSGTDVNGCVSSTSAICNVTVNALPSVNAITNTSIICTGLSATLTANGATTYMWNTTSTNTSIVVSPTVNTTYTVTGTDVNNCQNFSVITQSVSLCTGIVTSSEVEAHLVKIYPNPSKGIFNISCDYMNENNVAEIYNTLGQLILEQKIFSENTEIDLSENATGLYYLKVRTQNGEEIIKLIKE